MKIAFDLHGVLDTYPETIKPMIKLLKECGHTIYVISGPETNNIRKELKRLGYDDLIYYVRSVVGELKKDGVNFIFDKSGDPWCDDETWWDAKAKICKKYKIDILVDDSIKYQPAFDLIDSKFVHVSKFLNGEE
jgi:hypothetical protein